MQRTSWKIYLGIGLLVIAFNAVHPVIGLSFSIMAVIAEVQDRRERRARN